MIMRAGQQLLLPANPVFIWATLFGAWALSMLPGFAGAGAWPWLPDVLAIVLVFWGVHQPRRVGMAAAFLFGLAMDVHQGALLGQHALAYTVLSFLAIAIHRRLLWFGLVEQSLHVAPLFFGAHAIEVGVRLAAGDLWPGWGVLLAPVFESLLWPLASTLLLLPQRRTPEPETPRAR
jgi:rod shape-determining protein MreD